MGDTWTPLTHLGLHLEAPGLRVQRLHQHLQHLGRLLRHGGARAGGWAALRGAEAVTANRALLPTPNPEFGAS